MAGVLPSSSLSSSQLGSYFEMPEAVLMTEKMAGHSALARWAPIPLRLIVGYGFMQHGFASYREVRTGSRQFFTP